MHHRLAGGPRQGTVIRMWVSGPRHKYLGRTQVTEQVADPVGNLSLVLAQFAIGESEFKPTSSRHRKEIQGAVPFSVTNLDNLVRCWLRRRRVPAAPPVGGHGHRNRDTSVPLLRHEKATADRLVVIVGRQDQRSPGEQ